MLILGAHTATEQTSLALVRDGDLIAEFISDDTRGQARYLIPEIQNMMTTAGLRFSDIDLMSVTTGPGSFTGIRIGLAAMRGLSTAADIPLIGVSSFDVIAESKYKTFDNKGVYVSVNSFRQELFFQKREENTDQGTVFNLTPEEFASHIPKDEKAVLIGYINDEIRQHLPMLDFIERDGENEAHFGTILAEKEYERGCIADEVKPFYIRPPDVSVPKTKKK